MQSRAMSLVEAFANVAVGYGVAVATQTIVFPWFGLHATLDQNLALGMIFTIVSLVRSYVLRRLFNLAHWSKLPDGNGRRFHCREQCPPHPPHFEKPYGSSDDARPLAVCCLRDFAASLSVAVLSFSAARASATAARS